MQIRLKWTSVLNNFLVASTTWITCGLIAEHYEWFTHPAWWMLYGVFVYRIADYVSDMVAPVKTVITIRRP